MKEKKKKKKEALHKKKRGGNYKNTHKISKSKLISRLQIQFQFKLI